MPAQAPAKRRVTEASDKPLKRTRISRACDQCRIAREKCDGTQPTCSSCSISRRACTYTAAVKKRGIQPGYIRALELALAYLFQRNPENENFINDELAQSGPASILLGRNSKESNELHRRWRKSRFYTGVDQVLSGGEPARRDPSELSSPDSDEGGPNTAEPSSRDLPQGDGPSDLTNSTKVPLQQYPTKSTRLFIPLDSWRLMETYFTYTCWFPISEKHDLMKLSYSYPPEGLTLSPTSPGSGPHAELWSVLALASVHETNIQYPAAAAPARLYATARSLIPDESGVFDLRHVKALLNLAIFNIAHALMEPAWLIVAYASRILQSMSQNTPVIEPRFKHTLYGCFILDSILALQLDRRPYFRLQEIKEQGAIDDNGLDEWQPWEGGSRLATSRTPVLALSTFNSWPDILDLLITERCSAQDRLSLLKAWESCLPPKLAHVCATSPPASLTPTTVLLRLTYLCAAVEFTSSHTWLLRAVNLLEQAQIELGWKILPPVLRCLLAYLKTRCATLSSSHEVNSRLRSLGVAMDAAWPPVQAQRTEHIAIARPPYVDAAEVATLTPTKSSTRQTLLRSNTHTGPSTSSPTAPEAHSLVFLPPHEDRARDASGSQPGEAQLQELPSDLESFFDELAFLDTVNHPDTQPLFMQNLGFAPDADMTELFSEYVPIQSSTFAYQENTGAIDLDTYNYFDGS